MMKIGIIGCGKIAEKHLMGYRALKGVQLVLHDVQPGQTETLREQFGCDTVASLDDLLADSKLTAVDICTPTASHEDLIMKSLEFGKHVFCEKPLVDNLESALRIQENAQATGRIVMVGFLYRFHPAFELVKQVLEEKVIGQPYLATFRLGGRGSHRLWKHQRAHGGGAVNEMLAHMLDLALWYFGPMEVSNADLSLVLPQRVIEGQMVPVDAEDFALVKLQNSDGVTVFCQADLVTPSYMNYMEIMGTQGSLITSILDYMPTIVFCQRPQGIYQQGNNFFNFQKTNLFARELGYFVDCIRDGKQPQINFLQDSLELMRLLAKIKKESGDED